VRFFFDNCVTPHLVDALRCLDTRHELVHLRERFSPATLAPEWIRQLGGEGDWIIISGDPRISRGQAERAAWIESGLTAFFCGDAWASRKLMVQASELLRWWDDIVERAKNAEQGAGYLLDFKSKEPRQIYPTREPRRIRSMKR